MFNVTNADGKKQEFLVDMRKTGSFYLGKSVPGQKVKPDVTVSVSDKDMVNLSTGKLNVSDARNCRRKMEPDISLHAFTSRKWHS